MEQAKPAKTAEPQPMDKVAKAAEVQKLKKDQQAAGEEDSRLARRDAAASTMQAAKEEKRAFADSADRNVAAPVVPAAPPAPAAPMAAAGAVRERQESQPPPPAALRAQAAPSQARAKDMASAETFKESAKGPLEKELERIGALRKEGKHAEADEALTKFRREHPDYRIPEALWEQVKPR
jgi:hypothetical protein